jgi:hypothetical protein
MISSSTVVLLRNDILYSQPNDYAEIQSAYQSVGGQAEGHDVARIFWYRNQYRA